MVQDDRSGKATTKDLYKVIIHYRLYRSWLERPSDVFLLHASVWIQQEDTNDQEAQPHTNFNAKSHFFT